MPEKKIKEIVKFINTFLEKRKITIKHIILFGSYATKKYTKNSDIDIAIISDSFEEKDIFERVKMLKGLNWSLVEHFILPFDIVPLSLSEWKKSSSLAAQFIREGKILI